MNASSRARRNSIRRSIRSIKSARSEKRELEEGTSTSPITRPDTYARQLNRQYKKFMARISAAVDDYLQDLISSQTLQELHPYVFYPVGGFLVAAMIAVFVYAFVEGYLQTVRQQYLAPAAGNSASSLCDEVLVTNSGTFQISSGGYWEGDEGFTYADAKYTMVVQNLEISEAGYSQLLRSFEMRLLYGDQQSTYLDTAQQLVIWMSAVLHPSDASLASSVHFYMNAAPGVIFDRQRVVATLANADHVCSAQGKAVFDRANANLVVTYDVERYLANPNCSRIAAPSILGYDPVASQFSFDVTLDTRAMITALAVNTEILLLDDLLEVVGSRVNASLPGMNDSVTFSKYVDSRYEEMQPVLCSPSAAFNHCFVSVGNTLAFPVFLHRGIVNASAPSGQKAAPCDCVDYHNGRYNETSFDAACNRFDFMMGVVFFTTGTDYDTALLALLGVYLSDTDIRDLSYKPMFYSSPFAADVPVSYAERQKMFDFCSVHLNVTGQTSCTYLFFTLYDEDFQYVNTAVSSNYLTMPGGACQPSFGMSAAAWQRLRDTPFAPLTNAFVICRNDKFQALLDSIGTSSGLISFFFPFAVLLVAGFFVLSEASLRIWRVRRRRRQVAGDTAHQQLSSQSLSVLMADVAAESKAYVWPRRHHTTHRERAAALDALAKLLLRHQPNEEEMIAELDQASEEEGYDTEAEEELEVRAMLRRTLQQKRRRGQANTVRAEAHLQNHAHHGTPLSQQPFSAQELQQIESAVAAAGGGGRASLGGSIASVGPVAASSRLRNSLGGPSGAGGPAAGWDVVDL